MTGVDQAIEPALTLDLPAGEAVPPAAQVEPQTPIPPLAVLAVPPMPRRRRQLLVLATAGSIALHASSLLAFLNWRGQAEFGAVEVVTEAISVEIVESKVLEAMLSRQSSEPVPSIEATAPQDGSIDAAAAPSERPAEEPKEATEAPKPPLAEPEEPDEKTRVVVLEAPQRAEAETLPVEGPGEKKEPESAEEVARAKQEEAQRKEREHEKDKQAKVDSRAGGPTSRASDGRGAGAERASASTGSIMAYAAKVRAQVARNKPGARRARGTAVVTLAITPGGGLAFASIARTSGNPGLDEAALSAVRAAAPFPSPPAGATPAQLQFLIPFQFQ